MENDQLPSHSAITQATELPSGQDQPAREDTVQPQVVSDTAQLEKPLSKNAQKKLAKLQKWEAGREERVRRNKEKKLAKREAYKAAVASGKVEKSKKPALKQDLSALRVIIDCSFDHLMVDREIKSMCSQLTRCYAENRVARYACKIYITSWNAKIAERFGTVFSDQQKHWKRVQTFPEEYLVPQDDEFLSTITGVEKEDLIYLSADSENTIHEIDESKVYIIGGIVDKNRHKNLCQDKAIGQGIKTARLPIGDYIQMASRKVLAVNHVFEIMSRWLELRDWEKAFLSVIPKRKLPTQRTGNLDKDTTGSGHCVEEAEDDEDEDEDEDEPDVDSGNT
ncbi:tRNA [Taphrina deformans PYCC 5710]|uniref:tRNA (guanine(9)-N1)-methyltransferase n=1 Tax=Taphrina deformans (strain PYCC 5710 / ATCC 11124 / CBS 356.35 / IMI 108563 / JCM 9778 / NBRC 8474) TaxID=1097556 RepID=R4X7V9_TAPDE|nr:tRNA [Taphrina deformans PYCC 5710]|eukprot:CCG81301.1 tRNA [Taphrina deformans PYCC 5710]